MTSTPRMADIVDETSSEPGHRADHRAGDNASVMTENAIRKSSRAASSSRASMSRPTSSVPSG